METTIHYGIYVHIFGILVCYRVYFKQEAISNDDDNLGSYGRYGNNRINGNMAVLGV